MSAYTELVSAGHAPSLVISTLQICEFSLDESKIFLQKSPRYLEMGFDNRDVRNALIRYPNEPHLQLESLMMGRTWSCNWISRKSSIYLKVYSFSLWSQFSHRVYSLKRLKLNFEILNCLLKSYSLITIQLLHPKASKLVTLGTPNKIIEKIFQRSCCSKTDKMEFFRFYFCPCAN